MIGYIVSKNDYVKMDAFTVTEYTIENDGDYGGKSSVVISRKPTAVENDWFYMMDGNNVVLTGIIDSISNEDGRNEHTLNLKEGQTLFDQKILLQKDELLQTGIEDFIAECIKDNFTESDDELMNLTYVTITVKTHTPVLAAVNHENGIFNLCTYIGNAMTNYGVFTEMHFTDYGIEIVIEKKEQSIINIDCSLADIVNYEETYEINALAKLVVRWCTSDEDKVGTVRKYFLRANRTVTDDINDTDRAAGRTETIYIQAENEEKMYEEVLNQFKSNSYNHSVECSVKSTSKLFPIDSLFVGAEVTLKTRSHGIHKSIVNNIEMSNSSKFVKVKFGKLKITLIEKIRKGMSR